MHSDWVMSRPEHISGTDKNSLFYGFNTYYSDEHFQIS